MADLTDKVDLTDNLLPPQEAGLAVPQGGATSEEQTSNAQGLGACAGTLVLDALLWVCLLSVYGQVSQRFVNPLRCGLLISMVAWRFWQKKALAQLRGSGLDIPYACGYVAVNGRELFLVATMHISPKSPQDVKLTIKNVSPDMVMIELDEERLSIMQGRASESSPPNAEDLQSIDISNRDGEPAPLLTQRAVWNAEQEGETIKGDIVFDETNPHGMGNFGNAAAGRLALVQFGAPSPQAFAPFALKAMNAQRAGAKAVLVIHKENVLPKARLGQGSLNGELKVAWATKSCSWPQIPVLLLPRDEGEDLRSRCIMGKLPGLTTGADLENPQEPVHGEFQVLADHFPRRKLPKKLCQSFALLFSGIGILYGVIRCFAVEVGGEFLMADVEASKCGIPCACVDVDMNRFWARIAATIVPTPRNLWDSLTSWLAFPRIALSVLFPPRGNVDVLGSMVLQVAGFPLRTWLAFGLAGFCASTMMTTVFMSLTSASVRGAEAAGAVKAEDRDNAQALLALLVELYLMPQVYSSVAASRDEAMYQKIVAVSREADAKRFVVVVGSGHANGILHRAKVRGL